MTITPGGVQAHNLDDRYSPQSFAPMLRANIGPTDAEQREAGEAIHVDSWHLDIDTSKLRWESYVKAGYYVSA